MRDTLLLYVNGRRYELRGAVIFQPLSSWLRDTLGLTGTKIVCAEGDCGSCSVLLGRPSNGALRYRPVCSCIQYLFQLDATHIITIEGLLYDGELNPVQQSIVTCHGAQCGFCTPGIVTTMCALLDEDPAADRQAMTRGLVGNLCRCTGYGSILQAGEAVPRDRLRSLESLYDSAAIAAELTRAESEPALWQADAMTVCKPTSLRAASEFLHTHPQTVIIAGGTDLGVQTNKGRRTLQTLLTTRSLTELRGIERVGDMLLIGADTALTDFENALLRELPEYGRLMAWFGSPQIKNAGTLGGNIGNGSPIGDTMPALHVLNAEIELTGLSGARRVNINDFYTGYKQTVRRPDELITRVFVPLPSADSYFKLYKLSKRKDLDISTITAAFYLQVRDGHISNVRVAYGGVGPNILRMTKTEAALLGASWTAETFTAVGSIAQREISPIDDVRGAAEYRRTLAANLLQKFYFECAPPSSHAHSTNGYIAASSVNGQGGAA